jgi:phosphoglycerate dehydrogenase-like enzyme
MTHVIAVLDQITPQRADEMRALLPEGFTLTHGTAPGAEAMKALIADVPFAITGQVAVPGEVLRAAKNLKLLHKWGVGVDNIDVEAARALGIRVARTTGSNAMAVAEFTIGLMLVALRHAAYGHHMLKQGVWHGPGRVPGPTYLLSGKTVGIVGMGAIGGKVARLLRGFECRVLYAKRTRLDPAEEATLGATHATVAAMLPEVDVLSLHCPLTPETADLIDAAALARMKPSAVLVNVARGGVVVEADLISALRRRVIGAAAMDVFAVEPLPADSPLLGLDNLVVTPHLAAVTADTFAPTVKRMFANIALVARGEPVPPGDLVA